MVPSPLAQLANPEPTCQHERRPGTTVCLRCRHEARVAARGRQRALFVRVGGLVLFGGVVLTLGSIAFVQGRSRVASRHTPPAARIQELASAASDSVTQAGEAVANGAIAPASESAPGLVPVLPIGVTTLPDSAVVLVTDTLIAVDFDQIMLRTRRPAKFENFLRQTLPLIYGQPVASALSRMADGDIASQGDLIKELPRTGIRIPLDGARVMTVWPETRPGQDGPLVVRYRVTIS